MFESLALADALEKLGFAPIYHMREVAKHKHQPFWNEALDVMLKKRNENGIDFPDSSQEQTPSTVVPGTIVLSREWFNKFLGEYGGVTDIPASLFPAALLKAYPDARIILTTRSEDSWYESVLATIWHAWSSDRAPGEQNPLKGLSDRFHEYLWKSDFPNYGREAFKQHNEAVRKLVKELGAVEQRRFLDFELKQGWAPLCKFLDVDIPEDGGEGLPRTDEWAGYKRGEGFGKVRG